MSAPRIYVACLASYNAGSLRGVWIDATDLETIEATVKNMLESTGGEEWAIHDSEGFGSVGIGEYEPFADVAAKGAFIAEHGEAGVEWVNNFHPDEIDWESADERFADSYAGVWESREAFAESYLEDTGAFVGVPKMLVQYFDFENYARDLELGGDVWTSHSSEGLHVFWSR